MARASPELPTLTLPLKSYRMAPWSAALSLMAPVNLSLRSVRRKPMAYADGNCYRMIARGITAWLRIFPLPTAGSPAVPAITAIEDDVGSVQGILRRAAPRTTPRRLRGTTDIGSTVAFIDGDSAGFATVDASGNRIFEIATPLSESTHYHRPGNQREWPGRPVRTGRDHCRS